MISIEEIRDWIESFNFGANLHSVGAFEGEKEKIIGVFEVDAGDEEQAYDSTHATRAIDLVIHWNDDYNETDKKALEIYKTLFRKYNFYINKKHISFIIVSPVKDEYKDQYGIYNRSIRIKFIQ